MYREKCSAERRGTIESVLRRSRGLVQDIKMGRMGSTIKKGTCESPLHEQVNSMPTCGVLQKELPKTETFNP